MLSTDAIITLIVLAVTILLFITEWVSYTTIALLAPLTLLLTGVITSQEMVAGITNNANLMNVFMFMIGGTLLKTGAAKRFGYFVTKRFKKEKQLMLVLMITATVISGFFNNMATATVLVPLAIGTCLTNKELRASKLLMGIAIGCCLGGMLTIVGCSNNLLARSALEEAGLGTIGFFEFAKIGAPVSIIVIAFMYFVGYRLLPDVSIDMERYNTAKPEHEMTHKDRVLQMLSVGTFVCVIVGMMCESLHGLPLFVVCLIGVLFLLGTRTIEDNEAFRMVGFPSIMVVAGMLPLATAMTKSGAADWIADVMVNMLRGVDNPVLFCAIVFFVVCLLTQFMSNTATAVMFFPIGIAIANTLSLNPIALVMLVSFAAQCSFMTPMATPGNTYIMNMGGYKFMDFIKVGTPVTILSGIIGVLVMSILYI